MRLNQLVCTGPGESYPGGSITTFVGDNKVSVARYRLSSVLMMSHYRPSSGECSEKTRWVKHANETMDSSFIDLQFSFSSDPASSDNQVSRQDLGYPGQVIWTHEVTAYLDGDQSEIADEDDMILSIYRDDSRVNFQLIVSCAFKLLIMNAILHKKVRKYLWISWMINDNDPWLILCRLSHLSSLQNWSTWARLVRLIVTNYSRFHNSSRDFYDFL